MEGATYALRNGFDSLRTAGLAFDSIRITGGGSRSGVWRQMIADVFRLPVDVPQSEGAAFGAALQALWACESGGGQGELVDIVNQHVAIEPQLGARPDAQASAAYLPAYERFRDQLTLEIERTRPPHPL